MVIIGLVMAYLLCFRTAGGREGKLIQGTEDVSSVIFGAVVTRTRLRGLGAIGSI